MALDPSFIGRSYPRTRPYLVSREKIREFAGAIGDPNPVYRDPHAARAAGYADVIAPPTFAAAITRGAFESLVADPALGFDHARMVHGEQTFHYRRPLVAGDLVNDTVSVTDITTRLGSGFLTLRHEITTTEGEPVLTATALLVVRPGGGSTGGGA
ncbi:MaoC family dehydratase N-terminal domain-containing protein [Saccharothrix sp. Mg75]|uniref:MaoC family dehydratase N-terminal domain-containing protein n=1 Tax=Saccharothrix sp. Mg75 TaxID=3445357 RepID=UPI003EECFA51